MTHLETELNALKQKLLRMGAVAEMSLTQATRSLVERDDELARKVSLEDDVLDELEKEIDEDGITLLTKAPLASQLRLITSAMRIGRDLERIGDEATKIARRAIDLNGEPQLKAFIDIPRMSSLAAGMLKEGLDAFVSGDTAKAREVVKRDKEVDQLNKQLHRELVSYMIESPSTVTRSLNLMTASKALERIADHAKNVAEDVVFLYEAKDIRHVGLHSPSN
ncbi:MAG TPA: phosphate signaling complex protein PhoU [Candidatus Limnocylindria bacterium]|nr:phosphate signaling complex protein PhoU [Candidatus Limnocylindria bacterium]